MDIICSWYVHLKGYFYRSVLYLVNRGRSFLWIISTAQVYTFIYFLLLFHFNMPLIATSSSQFMSFSNKYLLWPSLSFKSYLLAIFQLTIYNHESTLPPQFHFCGLSFQDILFSGSSLPLTSYKTSLSLIYLNPLLDVNDETLKQLVNL